MTSGAPVVIVVTKWDLLEDHVRLRDAIGMLMSIEKAGLAKLVRKRGGHTVLTRRKVSGIWVVPVSAVGPNFALITPDGEIKKIGRGDPQPRNISVPLTTGLVDVSRLELDNYKKGARRAGEWRVEDIVKDVADVTKLAGFSGELAAGTFRLLSWPATFAFYRTRRYARRFRARGVDGVSSAEGAVMYIARALCDRQRAFTTNPEYRVSKVWGGRDGDWEVQ